MSEAGETDIRRAEIEASWQRCRRAGLAPSLPLLAWRTDGVDLDHRLRDFAGPLLDRMAAVLEDTKTAVVLTDRTANIIDRRVGQPGLVDILDDVGVAPGYSYAEDRVGTNAMGTAAEEGRPVRVLGGEHFSEGLRPLSCAGVPVVHPVTGQIQGVVDLTCFNADANHMLLPFLLEAVRNIEERFATSATEREHVLLDHFMKATRRTSRPILSIGDQVIIANGAAAQLLSPDDHVLLWESARSCLHRSDQVKSSLVLLDGQKIDIVCHGVRYGTDLIGAVVSISRPEQGVGTDPLPEELPGLIGNSLPWRDLCRRVRFLAGQHGTILFVGEPGSGRTSTARALLVLRGFRHATEIDCRQPDAPARCLNVMAGQDFVALLLQHIDALPLDVLRRVMAMATPETGRGIVATADPVVADLPQIHCFESIVAVPSLAARRDDIGALLRELLRRRDPERRVRITPPVVQALLRRHWPENVKDLEIVIRDLLARRPAGDIVVADLPVRFRPESSQRPLSPMELAEYQAIVNALTEADGNRMVAARRLGIARSTLYRKLSSYGIEARGTGFGR